MPYRYSKQTTFEKMYLLFCVFPSLSVFEKWWYFHALLDF